MTSTDALVFMVIGTGMLATFMYGVRVGRRKYEALLEHYDTLFKWSNENCRDCATGRVPRHAQPLPDPTQCDAGAAESK